MSYGSVYGMLSRLPAISQVTSAQINSFLLAKASLYLDMVLGQNFATPFSNNNATVNGLLVYDTAELLARDSERDEKTGAAMRARMTSVFSMLNAGKSVMLQASSITAATGSADTIFFGPFTALIASPSVVPPWMQVSAPQGAYPPIFDLDDWVNQQVDPNLVSALRAARELNTASGS